MKTETKSSSQKSKTKFRRSTEWTDFREQEISKRAKGKDIICDCCQRKFQNKSKFHLHHKNLDPSKYTDITNPNHFSVLCSPCHTMLHSLHIQAISKKNPTKNQKIIELQADFFI